MTVIQNVRTALLITVMGMGLVFLTLIVVMFAIWLLDRVFRPSPDEAQSNAGASDGLAVADQARALANEAAAIAVAILTERRRSAPVLAIGELAGDVVTVLRIDSGHGIWRSQGRLQAME